MDRRRRRWEAAASVAALALAGPVFAAVLALVPAKGGLHATCAPIPYAFAGDPPSHVQSEFAAAAAEVRRRTGLRFVPAHDAAPRLGVRWRNGVPGIGTDRSRIDDTLVGSGLGRWKVDGRRRVLAGAAIGIDARRRWTVGWDRGDTLTSVFVHELGHVVGLPHSDDPSSFMYPKASARAPRWTAEERAQLAQIGQQAGCRRV